MTIRYLNSPVTDQGDFLFPVSNNTLPAFLSYVIFDDYKISKQPCDWRGGFSIPSKITCFSEITPKRFNTYIYIYIYIFVIPFFVN